MAFAMMIMTLVAVSCGPSNEEKLLEGTWKGVVTEVDEDGDEISYKVTMKFNRERDECVFRIDYGYEGVGYIAYMRIEGDWLADDEEITFFFDEDTAKVEFYDAAKSLASMAGMSLGAFERMARSELVESIGIMDSMKIYSLSETTLKVDFDGSRLTLEKQ